MAFLRCSGGYHHLIVFWHDKCWVYNIYIYAYVWKIAKIYMVYLKTKNHRGVRVCVCVSVSPIFVHIIGDTHLCPPLFCFKHPFHLPTNDGWTSYSIYTWWDMWLSHQNSIRHTNSHRVNSSILDIHICAQHCSVHSIRFTNQNMCNVVPKIEVPVVVAQTARAFDDRVCQLFGVLCLWLWYVCAWAFLFKWIKT